MRTFYRGEYTAALSIYRQNIEEARDQHIRGYALSCVQRSLFAAPFKAAFGRLHQYRCLLSLLAPDGTCTTTHLESAALLRRTQTAVDDPATDAQVHTVTRALATSPYNTPLQDVPFSHEEVVDVLRRTPNNSAAGPDNSTPLMMKALCRYHPDFLLMIFNAALSLGYFPCCWRRARVTFIHKPGRPPERTSSYRPICVSSVSGKKLERLLNGRLQYFLHANGHIHPRPYGFTRGRSSVMALHDLKDQLLRFRNACTPAILISVDFHGAFDSVWHPYVLRYFRERLLHSKLYHLLRTFLEERTVFLRSHAGQVEASPSLSSPQGSPLSPLLWNVVIDNLLFLRMPRGVTVQAYADDTVILLPAATTAALSELTLEVLRRVRLWADSVKVSLNRDKTFCVLFHHGARGVARTRITVRPPGAQTALAFKDSIRILGVVFDARLSFFKHADYLRDKVTTLAARVAAFYAMQGSRVRSAHKTILYRQVVLPALTYASPIWWSESRVDCRLYARIVSIQRVALLAIPGAFRTTNTAALQHPSLPAIAPFRRLSRHAACNACRVPGIPIYTDGSYTNLSAGAAYVVFDPKQQVAAIVFIDAVFIVFIDESLRRDTGEAKYQPMLR
ncbi:probable RNA-directed DNA polymerase from transposon X-element [Rhipicephalus sanguineus]|uniref:probable RNA-directed DNA polymerase from transposon X-element n=1 Tax=Rhipicephalus sanguineus TaxID=34632 RepID=UPI0020C442C0|nr:probable RNA-directed DNA polymerase from transposon X-element [Rhipicephalus sanguineus]